MKFTNAKTTITDDDKDNTISNYIEFVKFLSTINQNILNNVQVQ